MFALLANQAFQPYTEIFTGIPPLALKSIQAGAWLSGNSLYVRLPMVLYSLLGVAAIFALVKRQAGPLAGLLAASFLGLNAAYFTQSASILAEVPAVAMALLSAALADLYRTRRAYRWLALSGAAFVASLALKLFMVFMPVIILGQLLALAAPRPAPAAIARREFFLNLFKMGAAWLAGGLALFLLFWSWHNPTAMYQQVIEFRTLLRAVKLAEGFGLATNLEILAQELLSSYLPLVAGGMLGLGLVTRQQRLPRVWLWPLWLGLALALLLYHVPLRARYLVMLAPPLAALSGIALDRLLVRLTSQFSHRRPAWITGPILTLTALIVLLEPARALATPAGGRYLNERVGQATSAASAGRLSALNFVRRITAPHACVITDDQRFALLLDRLVPPPLAETSTARLEVGWLTTGQVLGAAIAYHCPVLLANISDRFEEFLPDLRANATAQFALQLTFAQDASSRKVELFVMPLHNIPPPADIIGQDLGDRVTLLGVDVTPALWQPGREISITTYWQARQPLPQDYKIFIHLKGMRGQTVATFDHFPFETQPEDLLLAAIPHPDFRAGHRPEDFSDYPHTGLLPTRLWPVGQTIKETMTTTLPETLATGDYTLTAGLYHPPTGQRLPVPGTTDNEIIIGAIKVQH